MAVSPTRQALQPVEVYLYTTKDLKKDGVSYFMENILVILYGVETRLIRYCLIIS